MTLAEIRDAVDGGRIVHWSNDAYRVIHTLNDQWLILCELNGSATGLTWRDGVTMNENADDFYVGGK
jgi:hypothetical protein